MDIRFIPEDIIRIFVWKVVKYYTVSNPQQVFFRINYSVRKPNDVPRLSSVQFWSFKHLDRNNFSASTSLGEMVTFHLGLFMWLKRYAINLHLLYHLVSGKITILVEYSIWFFEETVSWNTSIRTMYHHDANAKSATHKSAKRELHGTVSSTNARSVTRRNYVTTSTTFFGDWVTHLKPRSWGWGHRHIIYYTYRLDQQGNSWI